MSAPAAVLHALASAEQCICRSAACTLADDPLLLLLCLMLLLRLLLLV
jgi:hypothetical protein